MSPIPPPPFAMLRARMLVLVVLWVFLLVALGAVTVSRQESLTASLETVYRDRVLAQAQLRAVGDAFGRQAAGAMAGFQSGRVDAARAASELAEARQRAAQNWEQYLGTHLVPEETRLVEQARPLLQRADASAGEAHRLLAAGDPTALGAWTSSATPDAFEPLLAVVDQLFALQVKVAAQEISAARNAEKKMGNGLLALIVIGFVLGGITVWALFVHYARTSEQNARALRRMNALYTALSRTNHLIVRTPDELTLLRELCKVCTETGHAAVTAVFVLDGRTATRLAVAGPAAEFFGNMPSPWDLDTPEYRQSVTATALSTGTHRIGQIAVRDGDEPSWRHRALAHGIRSIAAFPLFRAGKVYGSLTLYSAEAEFFDEAVVALLVEMAADVSFALDNADREAAKARLLRETEHGFERFQKLFRSSPIACVIATLADATVLEVNDVMCARYGARREDVVGQSRGKLGSLLIEADAQRYRELLHRDGHVRNMFGRTPLPDGGMADVIVNAETIEYQGHACVMAMLLDVTELRAVEAARQARTVAEEANRAKTAFLSHLSHELRTPLNAMLGFTQLVQRDAGARLLPQDIEQLDHIRQAGWHLLALLNDVMDVSRIEAGQIEVRAEPVQLAAVLDHVLRLTEAPALAAGVTLQADAATGSAVLADPVRLHQVLINLLSNAVKYNRAGGSVHVAVQNTGERVLLAITDTGLGMSAEQLQHLYEPFNRLGRERGGIEGTGLGLALTRQLVSLMGGGLTFDSQVGVGTTARLSLPAASASVAGPNGGAVSASLLADKPAVEPTGTVLYIEDNDFNVILIEQMLSRWRGVRLVHAGDGQTGIDQTAALQPDLVLMDMRLPDMGGIEILTRLREREATAGVRVVALSGSDDPADVQQVLSHGALDYWVKPVDLATFLGGIQRHLSGIAR